MKCKKWLSGLLAALVVLASLPLSALAQAPQVPTRGEVCTVLLAAADDYQPQITRADILRGDAHGALNEDRPATRAEAVVMLSRAFGPLPTPVGDSARRAYPAQAFTDLPQWAAAELENVYKTGILTGTAPGLFSPDVPITSQQLDLLIRRVYALLATNPRDDFYAAVNKDWLDTSVLPAGVLTSGSLYDMDIKVQEDLVALITDVAGQTHAKGSDEQKISALYGNILNWEARDKAGIDPLRPYLEAIDQAETLDDLLAAQELIHRDLGVSPLASFNLTLNVKDSNQYAVGFRCLTVAFYKEFYIEDQGAQRDAFLQYLTTLLTLGGRTDAQAAEEVAAYYKLELAQGRVMLSTAELGDVDKTYNLFTMAELQALFPQVDLKALYATSGLQADDTIVVADVAQTKAAAAYFTADYVPELKTAMRITLLNSFGSYLNREFDEAATAFSQVFFGFEGTQSDEERAVGGVQDLLPASLEKLYVERYFTAEAKADVEAMVDEILAVYRSRIETLDWMGADTKAMALKKLDSMVIKVGYPNQWDNPLAGVEIRSAADGGSYFENYVATMQAARELLLSYQGQPVDKSQWISPTYTVNAFYNPPTNDITFPAAVLQAPIYDVNASREENLGGIGYIIAHEITHAFDNQGAKFDEHGNVANWWTESDYAAFQSLCSQVVDYYDGVESIPGVFCDGTLTLPENVADLGAAACLTDMVRREGGDFSLLYTAMAKLWSYTTSRSYAVYSSQTNEHAPAKLRGYMPSQTQDEFYTAFGIEPGDGMWVPPENRVRIW